MTAHLASPRGILKHLTKVYGNIATSKDGLRVSVCWNIRCVAGTAERHARFLVDALKDAGCPYLFHIHPSPIKEKVVKRDASGKVRTRPFRTVRVSLSDGIFAAKWLHGFLGNCGHRKRDLALKGAHRIAAEIEHVMKHGNAALKAQSIQGQPVQSSCLGDFVVTNGSDTEPEQHPQQMRQQSQNGDSSDDSRY